MAIERSIEVDVPVHTAYNQWTQFEEFPRFMEGVKEVQQIDETHLYWHAEIAGKDKEWDAEITQQVPDQVISWRSVSGAPNSGSVRFEPLGPNRTRVNVTMEYDAQGFLENIGDALGMTERRIEADLERFKEFIESRGAETGAWRGEVHGGHTGEGGGKSAEQYAEQYGSIESQSPGGAYVGAGESPGSSYASEAGAMGTASSQQATSYQGSGGNPSESSQMPPQGEQQGRPPLGSSDPSFWSGEHDRRRADRRSEAKARGGALRRGSATQRWMPAGSGLWDDPVMSLRRMSENMDQMFDRLFGRRPLPAERGGLSSLWPESSSGLWSPQIDIAQRGNELVVSADLPGVRREDVHIDVQEGMLMIEGDREEQSEQSEQGFRRIERTHGHFQRSIPLPEGADIDACRASMNNGVLEIVIPTRAQAGRRIEIGEGEEQRQQRRAG